MKIKTLPLLSLAAAAVVALATSVSADPITVVEGIAGGSGDVDNVLYQVGETGNTIHATVNQNPGFNAVFMSTTMLQESGGQAHLGPVAPATFFTDLTFSLTDGATFTKLILNPDGIAGPDGMITFTVNYLMPAGVFNSASFTLDSNGNNFFTVQAGMGAVITSVSWVSTIGVVDANQYRVGGLAPAGTVPDGGTTLMLLGASLGAIELLRRRLRKSSPTA